MNFRPASINTSSDMCVESCMWVWWACIVEEVRYGQLLEV